ncbi:MAG: hypothetical protein JW735_03490, partial [Prolixibacteraceae bacterium]|nr:hypothetical protein [Prolixibacteraceae bacterium]
ASSRYFNVDSMQIIKQDSIYIPASHFEWYWIVSLKRAGYYADAKKVADYQRLIARKINEAISDGQLEKRKILVSMGPYFIMKQDVVTILKMLPRNYINRFYTPNHFHKSFMTLAVRKSRVENAPEMEKRWAAALNVNYISANDNVTQKMLMNKLVNHFWNLVVKLFSWLVVPLFHLTTPLAFLAIFLCIKNRVWHRALPLIVMIIGFWTHLAMLTAIDVVVGYKASNHAYFLPSYAIIIAAFFISLAVIVEYLRADKKMHLSERTVAPDESQK